MAATINEVLEAIHAMNPEELHRVERALHEQLNRQNEDAALETLYQALQASGLVKEIKRPAMRNRAERPLVPIKGKPISETIVEERR